MLRIVFSLASIYLEIVMPKRSSLTLRHHLHTALNASYILLRRLGFLPGLRLLIKLTVEQLKGAPFQNLQPALTTRDIQSRTQIGPAIILYKILRQSRSEEDALSISKEVIISSTLLFLNQAIGPIDPKQLAALSLSERESWVKERAEQFFNATMEWQTITAEEVSFTVTRCTFPELCKETMVPELAPLFCAGDQEYFGTTQELVQLHRPATIAAGAQSCPFSLTLTGSDTED